MSQRDKTDELKKEQNSATMVNTKLEHEQIFIPPTQMFSTARHSALFRTCPGTLKELSGLAGRIFSETEEFTLRCPQRIGAEPKPQPCLGDELQALLPMSTSNGMERFQALNGEGFGFHLMMPTFWVF